MQSLINDITIQQNFVVVNNHNNMRHDNAHYNIQD